MTRRPSLRHLEGAPQHGAQVIYLRVRTGAPKHLCVRILEGTQTNIHKEGMGRALLTPCRTTPPVTSTSALR